MANCPKCGGKLKITDWRPNCPHCGVNITYYGLDEKLQAEADKAEVEHAKVQAKIDRLKASFVGSPLAIVRIILSLLPIGMLMLPLGKLTYCGPFIEQTTTKINLITIINLVQKIDFGALTTMMKSSLVGSAFTGYGVSLIALLLSLVMVVLSLLALVIAMGPKGNIRNIINNSLAIIAAVVAVIFFGSFTKNIGTAFPEFISGSVMFGAYLYIASLVILLVINVVLTKNKIEVKYKPCYVGGIPVEEFKQALADGVPIEELHARMDKILGEKEAVRLAEENAKAEEKKKKEAEELAKKAGITAEAENNEK